MVYLKRARVFLNVLLRRNRPFLETAAMLHQRGDIPANSYVIDLDAVRTNARGFAEEASRLGLAVLAMTKQIGRNPSFLRAVADSGIGTFVAVDMADARRIHAAGYPVGHIGHLVQISHNEAATAASMRPGYWTVYSMDKAREASEAAATMGFKQRMLARIFADGDVFYKGHEGGFPAEDVVRVAEELDRLDAGRFAGITTFPALLFDNKVNEVRPTPNLATLERAAKALAAAGRNRVEINAPGTASTSVISILASAGATQVEPGHGLTGTTPLHAVRYLPELPAVIYLSEISHFHGGRAYCFGGGLYIDPVFPPYQVHALVGSEPEATVRTVTGAELPPLGSIDYYGILDVPPGRRVHTGDTVIFGFRIQAFVTRAYVVPVSGVTSGSPRVEGIWSADGSIAAWP